MKKLVLSRRNLEILLRKLDTPGSSCAIVKWTEDVNGQSEQISIQAKENSEVYAKRPAGIMLEDVKDLLGIE